MPLLHTRQVSNQYNYYTGDPDRTDTGGAPTTQAGYGPNIRTIMQIKVNNSAPAAAYDLAALNSVFAHVGTKPGVFETAQPPIIVPQIAYNGVYNQTITVNNYARIADTYKNFTALSGAQFNITFQPKALHDEMGAVYDQYGRMSGMLGLEVPSRTSVTAAFFPYPYSSPPTDVIMTSLGEMAGIQPNDGTQIWRLSHNGVDSHPIHWHMYNVQVLNRVGWDGFIRAPDKTELGWKDTLRVSPLEDTIVALRPVAVTVPFQVPDQVRAIEPVSPLGEPLAIPPGGLWFSPGGNPLILANGTEGIANHLVNYGWEYVWHCHILAHEEMDMMHAQAILVNAPGLAPNGLVSGEVNNATTNITKVFLAWNDRSTNETDWYIQRTNVSTTNWTDLKRVPSYSTHQTGVWAMAIDDTLLANETVNYTYRVIAANNVGDDFIYGEQADPGELLGFPYLSLNSTASTANVSLTAAAPTQPTIGATPLSGFVPLNVSFTNTQVAATGWIWDFGDGNYADDNGKQNPNHVYEVPGTYTVTLTTMNTGGFSPVSLPTTITVNAVPQPAVPTASFTATPTSGVAPFTVAFNDTSISEPAVWATREWAFGDGTFSSLARVNHTYMTGGNFTVFLTASNLGGSDVASTFINVTAITPVTDFIGTPTTGTAPLTVTFTDLSTNAPTAWNWSFGDGTSTTLQNPVHTYTTGGSFTVALNASNLGGFNTMTKVGYINVTNATVNLTDKIGVYQNGVWLLDFDGSGIWNPSIDKQYMFGAAGWIPVKGDWNGDGRAEIGITDGMTWLLDFDGNGVWNPSIDKQYTFGATGMTPVIGDWNGDGKAKIGITNGMTWLLDFDGNGVWNPSIDKQYTFGAIGLTPVVGDWNGDRRAEIGITDGMTWLLDFDGNGVWNPSIDKQYTFGAIGLTPVIGDWNSDGKAKIGITNGMTWLLDFDGNGVWNPSIDKQYTFGAIGLTPVIGDWNGDGKAKIGITNGMTWLLDFDGNGVWNPSIDKQYTFGAIGWTPLVAKWS